MTPDERLERYADLVVRVGANVQQGQDVVIFGLVEHAPIVRAVARSACRAGARRVEAQYSDPHLRRAAIELGPEEELGWSPPRQLEWIRGWAEERPAVIRLSGVPEPSSSTIWTPRSSRDRISVRSVRPGYRSYPTAVSTGRSSRRRTKAGQGRSSACRMSRALAGGRGGDAA